MSLVMRATELIGRPVVTLDEAVDVAEVKDVIFDPDRSDVAGFTLRGRGAFGTPDAGLLPIARVAAIGRDAVMIPSADAIAEQDARLDAARSDRRDVVGNDVVTDGGAQIGKVLDLILRVDGGGVDVAGYEVEAPDSTRSLVPIPATLAVSGATLMVPDASSTSSPTISPGSARPSTASGWRSGRRAHDPLPGDAGTEGHRARHCRRGRTAHPVPHRPVHPSHRHHGRRCAR